MILETERLLLRPLGMADLEAFVELHEDPEVSRFIRRLERPEAEARLRGIEREWAARGYDIFAVLDRARALPRSSRVQVLAPVRGDRDRLGAPLRRVGAGLCLDSEVVVYALNREDWPGPRPAR